MAEHSKVDDGLRTRLRKALEQLRKAREEERAAKEHQEEMQENVERAQERVLESEENLCKELDEYMCSWEQDCGRPNHLSSKIWHMMQSNNMKSENLEVISQKIWLKHSHWDGTKRGNRSESGRFRLIRPHWPAYPCGMGVFLGDFNICDPEEGRFNVWNQTFSDGDPGKTAVFHSFFPYILEVAQSDYTRRDSRALGVIRTLPRIDLFCVNLPMAEARDFHCYSHVVENLEKETIPSDHAAVRFVIQKPTNRGHQSKRIPSWMSKHPIFLIQNAAASWRPQILYWPILCTCWIKSSPTQGQEDDKTWAVEANTCLHRWKTSSHFYCIACLLKSTSWDTHAMLWGIETWSISRDSARFLPALIVKTSKHVKLKSQPCHGSKQKTLLWLDVEMANVHGEKKTCVDPQFDYRRRGPSIGEWRRL